jgi:hypothetical protein
MTIHLRNVILPAALALSVASVAPAMAQEPAKPAEAAKPPEPAKGSVETSGRISAPPAGKGQVVFFRPGNMMGMALSFSVHEGDTGIGKLGNGSYFVYVTDPGPHLFTIQSEATDRLTLEVDVGETYYVKQTIGVGIVAGRPHLAPAEQGDFERLKLKESTKKPSDLKSKGGDKADKADK